MRKLSIRTALTGSFALLILLAAGSSIYFGFFTSLKNTRALTQEKTLLITDAVIAKISQHLDPAEQAVRHLARLHNQGVLDVNDPIRLEDALRASLAAANQIESVLFAAPNLKITIAARVDGDIEMLEQDWTDIPAYVKGMQFAAFAPDAYWGEFVSYTPEDHPTDLVTLMNIRMPLRDNNRFVGMLVASVQIQELSRFLSTLRLQDGGVAFVLFGPDQVIAHPSLAPGLDGASSTQPLHTLEQVNDPVLIARRDDNLSEDIPIVQGLADTGLKGRFVELDDGVHVAMTRELSSYTALPWTVGAHFRRDAIASEILALRESAIATGLVLLLAIVAAAWLSHRLARPIRRLSKAARELRTRPPAEVRHVPGSRIAEMNNAASAFNEMIDGLINRELMRSTFGKYVPAALAEHILEDGGTLAPEARYATILFTDIVGFSSLAENMEPETLIGMLNDYFTVIAEPIEQHGGVIHQFQGDAILATFNLPVNDPQHARNAIAAALEIQSRLANREFANGINLATRIGINTGDIVGGTVGSEGRLGYTVHGDAVNLASRVEQLNKQFGTSILLTETTKALAEADFSFREIDTVEVRGRKQSVTLYSVA